MQLVDDERQRAQFRVFIDDRQQQPEWVERAVVLKQLECAEDDGAHQDPQ